VTSSNSGRDDKRPRGDVVNSGSNDRRPGGDVVNSGANDKRPGGDVVNSGANDKTPGGDVVGAFRYTARSPSTTHRRRPPRERSERRAARDDEKDDRGAEVGDEADEPDEVDEADEVVDAEPPPSLAAQFPGRGPPFPEQLELFKRELASIVKTYSRLVWHKLRGHDLGPESVRNLHQEVFMRLYALVKRYNVPPDMAATINSIAWRTIHAYVRDRTRKARHAGALAQELSRASLCAEPSAEFQLLLDEVGGQLPPQDAELLRWFGVEGYTAGEIAERLGVPDGTVYSRIRAARGRFMALLEPPSEREPGEG
jgi:RNA polymerase sigma factor (sigma-70 family)